MVFALSTDHEIGLATAGAIFIAYALACSFIFPRFNPDFPGRKGLRWYIPLSAILFVGMIASVLVFGREEKVATAGTSTAASGSSSASSSAAEYANGNAAAGKAVFASAGCGACHTLKAAGTSGTIGPNLDQVASYAAKANESLQPFLVAAIIHPPAPYVPSGFPTTVMPTTFGTSLSKTQIANLVAFIASSAAG